MLQLVSISENVNTKYKLDDNSFSNEVILQYSIMSKRLVQNSTILSEIKIYIRGFKMSSVRLKMHV